MTQVDTSENLTKGNVKNFRARRFSLCLMNYTEEDIKILTQYFDTKKYNYIIGREIAPSTGTKHLQMYIETKNAIWHAALAKIHKKLIILKSLGNRASNLIYCSKEGDFITNFKDPILFKKSLEKEIINDEYKGVKWHKWQSEVLDLLKKKPDNRTIHVFVDPEGNKGKSYLCKYIYLKYKGVIICDGKKDNIFNQIKTSLDSMITPTIIILDVPRSNHEYINYGAIEQIKNGLIYSGKYEGGICCFKCPHVIIFSNELPDLTKMSQDRWKVRNI